MAKTRRLMQESLPQVDLVLELLDARIPYSSKNPEIEKILGTKPRIAVLTKSALANPEVTREWIDYYKSLGTIAVVIDNNTGAGIGALEEAVRTVMAEKLDRYRDKGMAGRKLKSMIVGIPNVGKSSLINRLAGSKKTKVENRPGVTLNKQWVPTDIGLDLLDMPGVLWPKFEEERVGQKQEMGDWCVDRRGGNYVRHHLHYVLCIVLITTEERLYQPKPLATKIES